MSDGIAGLRDEAGLSQAQLAKRIGVSPGRVGDYEQHPERVKNMTLETSKRFADALGVTLDEFYARCVA